MLPRGIRNNNPLNIRRSKDKWKGLRAVQADAQFCQRVHIIISTACLPYVP